MAKHLTLSCLSLLLWASPVCHAETMTDPTQPPASLNINNTASPNASTVQSVTLGKTQRYAMINGNMVKVGDTIDAGRIIKITESDVWVKAGNVVSRISLFPNVSKHTTVRKHP
jgi:flagella basal body P-ring formation protein FlgA